MQKNIDKMDDFGSTSYSSSVYSDKEPQVTSTDPNERKMARRLRIERRIETLKRQNVPEGEVVQEKKIVEQRSLLEQQLEKSADVLQKLLSEGMEYVSNVRVANDSREVDRREEEGINRERIIEQLDNEAALATDNFNAIAEKWMEILKNNDPLQIHEDMNAQKEKCDELITQKDGIIAMLREEIKTAERKFTNDQYKQNEDIKTLTKRIENQVKLMRKAYRRELEFIEQVIMEERKLLVEANDKKWEELYKKRENEEKSQCDKKFEQHEEFVQEMNKLRIEHEEKFREAKILLENEVEVLQRDFERIKTMILINTEKIDYNYQILRKREDENLIINSQQKRRINKLQDVINGLKKKNQDYDELTKTEIARLTDEVMNMQKCVVEIEHKAVSLSKINDLKYKQIWDLNVENAKAVLNKILTIDRILHEQQLGLEWKKPDVQIMRKADLESYKDAVRLIELENRDKLKKEKEAMETKQAASTTAIHKDSVGYRTLLRHILQQISGKAGFLMEERLNAILAPYMEYEKTIVTMDNVFSALGVKEKEDMDILMQFFMPYAKCIICTKASHSHVKNVAEQGSRGKVLDDATTHSDDEEGSEEDQNEIFGQMMSTVNQPDDVLSDIMDELTNPDNHSDTSSSAHSSGSTMSCMPPTVRSEDTDLEAAKQLRRKKSHHQLKFYCKNNHLLQINPIFVIRALREFITKFYVDTSGVESLATRLAQKHTTVSRLMTDSDVTMYWKKYQKIFCDGKQKLWDGLFFGLQKYYAILRDRKKVNDEVMCLRRQNIELKHLLGKYASGKMKRPPCAEQREIPVQTNELPSCNKKF